ncbi:MAG: Gfo/Idh/MocA family oxidoreductase [Candidatus Omnitrophica bacterium]|nr:Gfo/Idh/MocA family oxidoreductase [Candidatus Omnitrophota bacterium]
MKKVKCAVVGAGIFGEIHCDTYANYEWAELIAICDLNETKGKELAEKYKTSYIRDYREIAKNREIEAVSVVTPDFAHKDISVEMLRSGKNVLVEKPMATKVDEAEEMVDTAQKTGVLLMTDFHNRFNPPIVSVKEKLEKGDMGEIIMMSIKLSDKISVPLKWFSWSGKSGPQWFLFPHIVDLACWLTKAFPRSVYARGIKKVLKSNGLDIYDVVSATLDFGNSFATLETSWIIPDNWPSLVEFIVDLQTSKGKAHMDVNNQGIMVCSELKNTFERPAYTVHSPVYNHTFGYASLPIKHFVDCAREKKEPIIKLADGLNNVKIISAIEKSIDEEKIIKIKY